MPDDKGRIDVASRLASRESTPAARSISKNPVDGRKDGVRRLDLRDGRPVASGGKPIDRLQRLQSPAARGIATRSGVEGKELDGSIGRTGGRSRASAFGGSGRAGVYSSDWLRGGFHYRGDHVDAGLYYGQSGWTAYYSRDKHRHGGHFFYDGYGHGGLGFSYGYRPSYHGEFYAGAFYPYGYASCHDLYYYRYPYRYVSYVTYPTWTVVYDPTPTTVYVESPQQVVYVQDDETVANQTGEAAQAVAVDFQRRPAAPVVGAGNSEPAHQHVPSAKTPSVDDQTGREPAAAEPAAGDTIEVQPQERIPVNNDYLAEAEGHFRGGSYNEARRLFSQALMDDSDNGFAELAYGLANFALGDYPAAASALRRGLALVPDVADRPIDVSRQYEVSGDFNSHLQALRIHVAANPEDADAWFVLGYVEYSSGDAEAAARSFAKAAELNPQDAHAGVLRDAAGRVELQPRP